MTPNTFTPEEFLDHLITHRGFTPCGRIKKYKSDEEITTEVIEECLDIMAEIITLHGEQYMPLLRRFHREWQARKENQNLSLHIQKMADKNTQNITT